MQCIRCDMCMVISDGDMWDGEHDDWVKVSTYNHRGREVVREFCPNCKMGILTRLHITEEELGHRRDDDDD